MLQLQRTLGNQGVVSMLARNGKKNKKPPPKPIDIDVDDTAGTIKTTAGELIGFKTGSDWYATPGAAAPSAATLGELETSAGKLDILKVRKSTVTVGADGSETMTQDGAESGAVLGTDAGAGHGGQEPGRDLEAAGRAEEGDPGQRPDHPRRRQGLAGGRRSRTAPGSTGSSPSTPRRSSRAARS